jgi:hypothetical protein
MSTFFTSCSTSSTCTIIRVWIVRTTQPNPIHISYLCPYLASVYIHSSYLSPHRSDASSNSIHTSHGCSRRIAVSFCSYAYCQSTASSMSYVCKWRRHDLATFLIEPFRHYMCGDIDSDGFYYWKQMPTTTILLERNLLWSQQA